MRAQELGHVVLNVRDLQRSEAFYEGILGMQIVGRITDPVRMTLFTLGSHHDFGVLEVDSGPAPPEPTAPGLAHVAFKIGDCERDLIAAKTELIAEGVTLLHQADRAFTKSLHVSDPDGHEVELYIDVHRDSNLGTLPVDATPGVGADNG